MPDGPIGIGTPGAYSRASGLVKNSNSVWLIGGRWRDLEARLEREVRITNDANCFALSEATDGAGAGADVVFGVILGTGVGGGIVVHGRVLDGPNLIAGEWGHNPLPVARRATSCRARVLLRQARLHRDVASGPASRTTTRKRPARGSLPEQIVERRDESDAACAATLVRYERPACRALAHVINILDPDVIVLGGGLSNLTGYSRGCRRFWGAWVFSDAWTRASCGTCTATRAACAGRRGWAAAVEEESRRVADRNA